MLTVSNSTDDNRPLRRPLLQNEDSAMASPSSLPSQSEGTEEPSRLARSFGLLALLAVVLVPLAAIGLGAWLWYSSSHGSLVIPGASRVSDDLAPSAADRNRVAAVDQGIDFSASARGDVYPLRELSTGRQITEDGEPVYVNRDGARVTFPVLFRDDFTNPGSGWSGGKAGAYSYGEYRLLTTIEGVGWEHAVHNMQFGDFQARLDARLDRPTTGVYLYLGFRFREQANGSEGYVFVVTPDTSSFRLELWRPGEGGTTTRARLIDETTSPAILFGTDWNRLVVRAVDSDITLLVNGEVVGRAQNDTLKTGALALGVGKLPNALTFANGDARFANLVVSGTN